MNGQRVSVGVLAIVIASTLGILASSEQAFAVVGGGREVNYNSPTPVPAAPLPVSSPSSGSRTGTDSSVNAGGCHFYAGPGGFGQKCYHPGSLAGHLLTVAEVLAGDPLPGCWDTALTAAQLNDDHLTNTTTYTWFSQQCLTGIGPAPKYTIGPDGPSISDAVIVLPVGSTPPGLTVNQQHLVGLYQAGRGDYPAVVAIPNGSGVARVNQQVAFHGAPAATTVQTVAGTAMQARVTHLSIKPLGPGNSAVTECDGAGALTTIHDQPDTTAKGSVCWYQFRTSSAAQPDQAFPMAVTATWEVRYTTDPKLGWDAWTVLGANIHVTTTTDQKVTEVQAIIVN